MIRISMMPAKPVGWVRVDGEQEKRVSTLGVGGFGYVSGSCGLWGLLG